MDFLGPLCQDASATLWGLFDPSVAPPLLFYSYIPIIFASALIGVYVFLKDRRSLQSRLFLAVTLFFVLWVLNILVQWVGAYDSIVMFAWQLTAFFEVGMFFSTLYFAYVFLFQKDIPNTIKIVLFVLSIATLALLPTTLNISSFDLGACQGNVGVLWDVLYKVIEPAVILLAVGLGALNLRRQEDNMLRRQTIFFTIGLTVFLTIFYLSNFYGQITLIYTFNLWGPLGMLGFLLILEYLIIEYKSFNIRAFGAQLLIVSLILLICSEYFFVTSLQNRLLVGLTLFIAIIFGFMLVRSVRKEIQQREQIEKLAHDLEETNKRQETLIHFVGHEVKGFLTKDQGVFASLVEGDFGVLGEGLTPFVQNALAQTRSAVRSVTDILAASNLKKGTTTFEMKPFDLKELAKEATEKARPMADQKGLALSFSADESVSSYTAQGDRNQIGDHVMRNLIENAVHYTLTGKVDVTLKKEGNKFVFAVHDTGVGISEEDGKRLFTEGGHGKDSIKINVHSTGYGLFIAKNIVVAHKGTIRAESEGPGKGSTFVVELPA